MVTKDILVLCHDLETFQSICENFSDENIKVFHAEFIDEELWKIYQEQREPHYFEDMYPHAIRHTFCSRCFEADMQPKVVQSIMGHQHYSTTIDIYTHVSEIKYQEEIGKFGRAVEPVEGSGREEPEGGQVLE